MMICHLSTLYILVRINMNLRFTLVFRVSNMLVCLITTLVNFYNIFIFLVNYYITFKIDCITLDESDRGTLLVILLLMNSSNFFFAD